MKRRPGTHRSVPILGTRVSRSETGEVQKSVHTAEYALFVRQLRDARLGAGLSQRALAKLLKVPHTWVAKVESGERRIDVVESAWFFAACQVEPIRAFERIWGRNARSGRSRLSPGAAS